VGVKIAAWLVVFAVSLFLLDRILLWAEKRGWIYWRRRKAGVGARSTASMIEEFQAFLSPTVRYAQEEKDRRLVLREDDEAGAPPNRRIDLESGMVTVRTPASRGDSPRNGAEDREA